MATLTEGKHAGEFIISEQEGWLSRDAAIIKSGQNLVAGTVLGAIALFSATSTAGTNTGNGTMGTVTVSAGAMVGDYILKITKAATNAGDFQVVDPQGDVIGIGSVAAAFSNGGLSFTLADGATDFAVGDTFRISVTETSRKYVLHDPSATDGSQKAVAILQDNIDASAADMQACAFTRLVEVNGDEITWKSGISAAAKAMAIRSLAETNIIVR